MPETLLRTKLFVPPLPPDRVPRPRLVARLNQGLAQGHKLTLVSAPAGFGKTTLVGQWLAGLPGDVDVAWLSLDARDHDPARFLSYLAAALQTASLDLPAGLVSLLGGPQPPPAEDVLTAVINAASRRARPLMLVLDDYHLVEAAGHDPAPGQASVDGALAFLLDHLPPGLHLVILTRSDPNLPLAALRAGGRLNELRAADLRFSTGEAAAFLNQVMDLDLPADDVAALETRTEGWIAGLQLAGLALKGALAVPGRPDPSAFIRSFSGSHRFVLDYLVEEVLDRQPPPVRAFLRQTAILERLTGPLCDAVTGRDHGAATLASLEQANLFIVPLDQQRQWYRYHHLFADLLRRRAGEGGAGAEGHRRASAWYEANGLALDAFQHAAAAGDVDRAARLLEGDGLPLHYRGVVDPVLRWLAGLPAAVLDRRPALWTAYAMALLTIGQTAGVEEKLQAAEAALDGVAPYERTRDLVGRIADIRGTLAVGRRDPDLLLALSRRALDHLRPDNHAYRTSTTWKLGVAYEFQGERAAAARAFEAAIVAARAAGNTYIHVVASTGLGNIQLAQNQLHEAAETYRRVLQLVGDLPIPVACHVNLCLARIHYQWNELEAAEGYGRRSLEQGRRFREYSDIYVAGLLFLGRLKLAQGDPAAAVALLAEAEDDARRRDFQHQAPRAAALRVRLLLAQGDSVAAAALAREHDLPLARARVHLAQADPAAALATLQPLLQEAETLDWADRRLSALALLALAARAGGDRDAAVRYLEQALALAEPGRAIRLFVDEGPPMARLLAEARSGVMAPAYVDRLLAAFPGADTRPGEAEAAASTRLVEPLSERELEVLALLAAGLTNRQIAGRLVLSVHTIKVHTRNIYGKLAVHSRVQAAARARELGLLPGRSP